MTKYYGKKRAFVFGASGGIGSAIAAELARSGYAITGFARRVDPLERAFVARGIPGKAIHADLGDVEGLIGIVEGEIRANGAPDLVVVAAGHDVRAPFEAHTDEDVDRSIAVNFRALVALCRSFHERFIARDSGTLAYVGGFGDGSIAFPFHSVDAATRAAAGAFLSALNRELPKRSRARYLYFGPTAAETGAEEPYLPLWRKMGTPVASADDVARSFLRAVARGRRVYAMGGVPIRLGIAINAISKELADLVFMNGYRAILEPFFRAEPVAPLGTVARHGDGHARE